VPDGNADFNFVFTCWVIGANNTTCVW
jgi:hypothetical protein